MRADIKIVFLHYNLCIITSYKMAPYSIKTYEIGINVFVLLELEWNLLCQYLLQSGNKLGNIYFYFGTV